MAGEYIEFNNNSQPALNDTNINRLQQLIKQDIQGAVSGDTLPVGAIMPFGSDTIPENWLLCNGQAVSRTEYQDLFNTIGITFGQGDGFTTFNLPDLQGKTIVGKDENDTDFDVIGEIGGNKEHYHGETNSKNGTLAAVIGSTRNDISSLGFKASNDNDKTSAGDATDTIHSSQSGDSGGTFNHWTQVYGRTSSQSSLQPYQVQNYIIKAKQSAGIVATVVDNLNSTSTTDALSANQGRNIKEKAIGTILYEDSTGTLGNVTLSDAAENYNTIEIFYKTSRRSESIKVVDFTNKGICLSFTIIASNAAIYLTKEVTISGTTITKNYENQYIVNAGITQTDTIYIYKVIGYK